MRRGGSRVVTEHAWLVLLALTGCTTVDPGSNFSLPVVLYNANYFYCYVEPQLIFGKNCGPGDQALGDPAYPPGKCHYNPSEVSGMVLVPHTPVDCGGGANPIDTTETGTGTPAAANLAAVSLEMSPSYLTAPLYLRPTGTNHPRQIFLPTNPVVTYIETWAGMQ